MDSSIRRTSLFLLLMLLALALVTGYWQAVRSQALVARDDNPRLVLAERQIPRGAILDRNGTPLAISSRGPEGYTRFYPEPSAAPVVGYYSLRYGMAGAEAAFDGELRGTAGLTPLDDQINKLLHRVPAGRSVRLTLDVEAQRAADAALGDRRGAVVVLSVPDGQVIALASRPTFNPSTLDEDWERLRADPSLSLLNRATQGVYQPGAAFQTVVLGTALSRGLVQLTDTVFLANQLVTVGSATLECAAKPAAGTLAAAFAAGCPGPVEAFAGRLDAATLMQAINGWGLNSTPDLFGRPAPKTAFTAASLTTTQALRDLALGQGALTVSPLQMALVAGVIADNGRPIAPPHLADQVPSTPSASAVVPSEVARSIREAMLTRGDMAGQVAMAVSGENRLAWFVGMVPADAPKWVIVVLLENEDAATSLEIAARVRPKLTP